jgi:hypothetical protein
VSYNFALFYGWKKWLLNLRQNGKLSVFQNRALKSIFGPKRDEVAVEWRKLHNEELNDLYCSSNIIRVIKSIRIGWACSTYSGEERCVQGVG